MKRKLLIALAFAVVGIGVAGGYYYYFGDQSRGVEVSASQDGPGCGGDQADCAEITSRTAKSGDDGGGCGGDQAACAYETP